ncbi:cyclin-L1 [Tetranychus urticae]|uniref:Cyclin-like domain-containing protein n=1 Tax=Tetranychus urticae TaxID=32264 RepID=T1L422_TETUR|nr:cyclin-L1 [Tetranychus urticae]
MKSEVMKYEGIAMSYGNIILPSHKFMCTPSFMDGLDAQSEYQMRILGTELIQTAGILLKLPQIAMATGQVLFQRFYYSKSFVRHKMEITAMACTLLASKIEEAPRRIRDIINVFNHIRLVRAGLPAQPVLLDQTYIELKNEIIYKERQLLKETGFCVHMKHPHKFIVTLLQILDLKDNKTLMQISWNYMNDSLRTDVFLRWPPETIACACVHLSANLLGIPLLTNPAWYELFDASKEGIEEICLTILKVYTLKKPNQEELEQKIDSLRQNWENKNGVKANKGLTDETNANINTSTTSVHEKEKKSSKNSHNDNSSARSSTRVENSENRSRSKERSKDRSYYKSYKKHKKDKDRYRKSSRYSHRYD